MCSSYFYFYLFCFGAVLRQALSMQPWLFWNSLCETDWPWTHRSLPVSVFQVLTWNTCITTLGILYVFTKEIKPWTEIFTILISGFHANLKRFPRKDDNSLSRNEKGVTLRTSMGKKEVFKEWKEENFFFEIVNHFGIIISQYILCFPFHFYLFGV